VSFIGFQLGKKEGWKGQLSRREVVKKKAKRKEAEAKNPFKQPAQQKRTSWEIQIKGQEESINVLFPC